MAIKRHDLVTFKYRGQYYKVQPVSIEYGPATMAGKPLEKGWMLLALSRVENGTQDFFMEEISEWKGVKP